MSEQVEVIQYVESVHIPEARTAADDFEPLFDIAEPEDEDEVALDDDRVEEPDEEYVRPETDSLMILCAGDVAPEGDLGDNETSIVTSVQLHLLSEHAHAGALYLDDDEGRRQHVTMHAGEQLDHEVWDLRFRPKRAVEVAMAAAEADHPQVPVE